MARIVVVGGGIAGLCAAHELSRKHGVMVAEAAPQLGGQLATERRDGFVIELGAEGYVARSRAIPGLAEQLGIADQLTGQLTLRSLGYRDGRLIELAPGESASMLGFQVPREDLGQGIRTHRRGMDALIDALRAKLAGAVELRTGFRARHIERRAKGYVIEAGDGVTVHADKVVIATSARDAAPLLTPVVGPAAEALTHVTVTSNVNVSLTFARDAVPHALDATGFVVATAEQIHGARACTFASSKFEGRAPEGFVNLRVFFRPDPRELKMLDDASYVTRAREVIARALGVLGPHAASWVARWPDALPVFDEASKRSIAALETALKGSGIALASSAFHGPGVEGAVRSGLSIGERLR
jgi:oxygen-dependent protoporphyrinogen oxidase